MDETGVPPTRTNNKGKAMVKTALAVGGAIVCIVLLVIYLQYRSTHITTDDAYVEGTVHTVASKVGGTVKAVLVKDNQFVRTGDTLVKLDEADYRVRVREASSAFDAEKTRLSEFQNRADASKKQLQEVEASIGAAKATVDLENSTVNQARLDMKRGEALYGRETISKERYEQLKTALDVAEARSRAARERVKQLEASLDTQRAMSKQSEAAVTTQHAVIKVRQAALESALLNESYTTILAPSDGYVTKKNVQVGNQVGPGQPLLAIVCLDDTWIVANYKETQLEKIKPGQKVDIQVDASAGSKLRGVVESVMAGTGSSFSLFPPENATGNYVKVVQRVPVKIILEKDTDKEHVLRIGMSVVPTVIVR
jgi:membrane fusion protein, multidrug efflux system